MKLGVVVATVAVVALLSNATGARGQGVGWESSIREVQSTYQTLAERGVRPALIYDAEGFADLAGGARRGATYLDNLNLQLTLDLRRLVGWPGATIFLYGLGIHGGQPSQFAGDAQGVSSIEAPRKWTLEEAWLEQNFLGNRVSALVGRYDLNTEFYRVHTADLFLNASFGMGPEFSQSGKGGPSVFPNTSVGGRFEVKPIEGMVLRSAVLDGVPVERPTGWDVFAKGDGLLIVGEAAFLYRPPPSGQPRPLPHRFRLGREAQLPPYDAKLAIGVWHYTASFPDLSQTRGDGTPVRRDGSTGAYVIGESGRIIGQVLGSRGFACRFGGDEYLAVLPGLAADAAEAVGEEIRAAIGVHPFEKDGVPLRPGISIGVAAFPGDAQDCPSLFQRADEALYRAKQAGKNRVCR